MCGRAKLSTDYSEIKIQLRFSDGALAPNLRPSWNIAPTQDMLTAIRDPETGARVPMLAHWGLIPGWAKEPKLKYPTFNARADGIDTKPTFRNAWRRGQRCLVVTDGFYEWRKSDKQPFAIQRAGGKLTIMAGLWELWCSPKDETIRSCTIITTDANADLSPLHDRMPVILAEEDWPVWLGESDAPERELKALLRPYSGADLTLWQVDRRVGNVRNHGPELADPVQAIGPLLPAASG